MQLIFRRRRDKKNSKEDGLEKDRYLSQRTRIRKVKNKLK